MLTALLLLMILIWGSNFSVIKYALREFPETSFNATRLLIASSVFAAALLHRRLRSISPREPALTSREWGIVCLLGLLGNTLYQILFIAGVARTSVANSALIFGCTPVAVAILTSLAGHERLTTLRWVGVALSFAGVYTLVGLRAQLSSATLLGDALVLGGMLCWSLYSVIAQPLLRTHSPLVITGWAMITGTVVYVSAALPAMWRTAWADISLISWLLTIGSALLALSFAYIVWYTAVQRLGSARTAAYSNLTPIVAMAVAAVWLGERITSVQVLGATLVLSGLVITRLRGSEVPGFRSS